MFQKFGNKQYFTKLNLADAYLQLEKDYKSRRYLIFTTHKGLYRENRLAFSFACASAIFQYVIEQMHVGVLQTLPYRDDIVVTGANADQHIDNLRLFTTIAQRQNLPATWQAQILCGIEKELQARSWQARRSR